VPERTLSGSLAGSIAVALYPRGGQFLAVRNSSQRVRGRWPILAACRAAAGRMPHHGSSDVGVPMLLAGSIGCLPIGGRTYGNAADGRSSRLAGRSARRRRPVLLVVAPSGRGRNTSHRERYCMRQVGGQTFIVSVASHVFVPLSCSGELAAGNCGCAGFSGLIWACFCWAPRRPSRICVRPAIALWACTGIDSLWELHLWCRAIVREPEAV